MPEMLPEALASLAAWLQPVHSPLGAGAAEAPAYCPMSHNGNAGKGACRQLARAEGQAAPADTPCAVCSLLEGGKPNWQRIIDLFVHCRALREFADHAASWAHTSHVAAIILAPTGRVLDCDYRGESFLKTGNVLHIQGGELHCADAGVQPQFNAALKETASAGRTTNLLLHAPEHPEKRFSLTLTRMQLRPSAGLAEDEPRVPDILCLVAPLDGRRIATARQLMDFFGLSAAEARLARAICHGDSVEEYARDQGLRLPTVRTQLSAIFNKTGTDRQAMLVRLIAGIPVVRDSV
jgi:DNA-binding CsgD family transcriptional regulator